MISACILGQSTLTLATCIIFSTPKWPKVSCNKTICELDLLWQTNKPFALRSSLLQWFSIWMTSWDSLFRCCLVGLFFVRTKSITRPTTGSCSWVCFILSWSVKRLYLTSINWFCISTNDFSTATLLRKIFVGDFWCFGRFLMFHIYKLVEISLISFPSAKIHILSYIQWCSW